MGCISQYLLILRYVSHRIDTNNTCAKLVTENLPYTISFWYQNW